jgi:hypothetical protein
MNGHRNLKLDLKTCEKATAGPWEMEEDQQEDTIIVAMATRLGDEHPDGYESQHEIICDVFANDDEQIEEACNNMEFIAKSREGWPYALRLLNEVAKCIQDCKANNGAVYLGDELEAKIRTVLE